MVSRIWRAEKEIRVHISPLQGENQGLKYLYSGVNILLKNHTPPHFWTHFPPSLWEKYRKKQLSLRHKLCWSIDLNLKFQMLTTSVSKDIWIRKFLLVAHIYFFYKIIEQNVKEKRLFKNKLASKIWLNDLNFLKNI